MTLCIGALAHINSPFEECIVTCFDSKVSSDEFGSETEYKFRRLSDNFIALLAGRPGRSKELCWIYESHLRNAVVTKDNVHDLLRAPVAILKQRIADAYIGKTLGMSYQDYLDNGERWFGPDGFKRHEDACIVEQNQLGVSLLIAGFIGKEAVLAEVTRTGDVELRTNFALIGTGAYVAEPLLHWRKQQFNTSIDDALYNVFEAMRYGSQLSPTVGQETTIYVLTAPPKGEHHIRAKLITEDGRKWLEQQYEMFGPKPRGWTRVPDEAMRSAYFSRDDGY